MLLPTAYYGNAGPAKAVTPVGQVGGFIVQRSSGGTILPAAYCFPYTLSVSLRLCVKTRASASRLLARHPSFVSGGRTGSGRPRPGGTRYTARLVASSRPRVSTARPYPGGTRHASRPFSACRTRTARPYPGGVRTGGRAPLSVRAPEGLAPRSPPTVGHGSGVPAVVPGAPHAETPPVGGRMPPRVCAPEGRAPGMRYVVWPGAPEGRATTTPPSLERLSV